MAIKKWIGFYNWAMRAHRESPPEQRNALLLLFIQKTDAEMVRKLKRGLEELIDEYNEETARTTDLADQDLPEFVAKMRDDLAKDIADLKKKASRPPDHDKRYAKPRVEEAVSATA